MTFTRQPILSDPLAVAGAILATDPIAYNGEA
jgi:hypothetical protein